jgi:hypothetical protein
MAANRRGRSLSTFGSYLPNFMLWTGGDPGRGFLLSLSHGVLQGFAVNRSKTAEMLAIACDTLRHERGRFASGPVI